MNVNNYYRNYIHMGSNVRELATKLDVTAQRANFAAVMDIVSGFFSYNLHLPYGAPVGIFSLIGVYGALKHNMICVSAFAGYEVFNVCVQMSLFTTLCLCYMDKDIETRFGEIANVNMDGYHYTVGIFFLGISMIYKVFVTYLFLKLRHELIYAKKVADHLLRIRRGENDQ